MIKSAFILFSFFGGLAWVFPIHKDSIPTNYYRKDSIPTITINCCGTGGSKTYNYDSLLHQIQLRDSLIHQLERLYIIIEARNVQLERLAEAYQACCELRIKTHK